MVQPGRESPHCRIYDLWQMHSPPLLFMPPLQKLPRRTATAFAMLLRWPLLVASALTLLLLGTALLYWQGQERQTAERVSQDFQRAADSAAYNLKDRLESYELILRGLKGLFDSSEDISREEFQTYIETLQLKDKKPGLQGASLIRWLDSAEAKNPSLPAPDKNAPLPVWPAGTRVHYAVLTYIEPLTAENQKVLGFDVATDPQSWEALELARDSGEPAITRKMTLAQDVGNNSSSNNSTDEAPTAVVMYLPLYAHRAPLETLAQRRMALRGWVTVQFRMQALMQGLAHKLDANMDLRIYDSDALDAHGLLYSTSDTVQNGTHLTHPSGRQATRHLTLGGRSWTLFFQPLPDFVAQHTRSGHGWVAAMGALGSLMLGWLAWLLLTGRERAIALARDITEHKLAYYDALTGLPNRALLREQGQNALTAHRRLGEIGALICLDLDNFKQINDARGHAVGDELLIQVAQRLSHLLRSGDTVARLGGDEFVVLLHALASDMETATAAALRIGEQIRSALEVPHLLDERLYSSSASIGITLFPKKSEGVDDLLREADTAMCLAKKMERNHRLCFFEVAMLTDAQENLALAQDVKVALERGEISAYVQSQVNANATVVGGELLLRWNHPLRGNVSPDCFISVAEESGLILHMGDWVLVQACEVLVRLQATRPELSLSVNVSPRQFLQDDFVERIRTILQQTGAPPTQLILEITETLLVDNQHTIDRMTELVHMGIRFSIDDFGTGYSSLSYLKKLPLFELKIDKSFVQDIPDDADDTAIVQAILAVAQHLKLHVVAEGVETQAQADFLLAHHCNELQGYLFERPMLLQSWLEQQLRSGA